MILKTEELYAMYIICQQSYWREKNVVPRKKDKSEDIFRKKDRLPLKCHSKKDNTWDGSLMTWKVGQQSTCREGLNVAHRRKWAGLCEHLSEVLPIHSPPTLQVPHLSPTNHHPPFHIQFPFPRRPICPFGMS